MRRRGTQFTESGIVGLGLLHPSLGGTKVPEVIEGRVVRHVMHQADIVHTKADSPGEAMGWQTENERGYPSGTVHTSQGHLHVPTLNRYATGDIPKYDPDYDIDDMEGTSEIPYHPETYEHEGKTWVAEGHHRIVADRLRA